MRNSLRFSLGIAALIMVGCGGSGPYNFLPPAVAGTTDTPPSVAAAPTNLTAQPVVQVVTATFPDPITGLTTVQPVSLPGGETLTQGEPSVIIPLDFPVPIDVNLLPGIATPGTVQPATTTTPGEIWLSRDDGNTWHDTHLTVNGLQIHGALAGKYLILAARGGSLDFSVDGPFHMGSGKARLDVTTELDIHVEKFGINSYPRRVVYTFPPDSGNLTQSRVSIYWPSAFSTSGGGSSEVAWGAIDKWEDATIFSDHLSFIDPIQDNTDPIPSTGVDFVAFDLDQTTRRQRRRH